jgi:hypothetical protein
MASKLAIAVWVLCPGYDPNDNGFSHAMRDYCFSCAPFWESVPICPHCKRKAKRYGRQKCQNKECGKFYMVTPENKPSIDALVRQCREA